MAMFYRINIDIPESNKTADTERTTCKI